MIVREFRELKNYDDFFRHMIEDDIENRLGEAGDLIRNIIIYEEGGLYLDNDVKIHTW